MYMSVEDQYFWECILAISIGIPFLVWYVKRSIDEAAEEQYQRGYDQGWDDCIEQLELYHEVDEW